MYFCLFSEGKQREETCIRAEKVDGVSESTNPHLASVEEHGLME